MIIRFPYKDGIQIGDLIAIIKNNVFIGYGEVTTVIENSIFVTADSKPSKILKALEDAGVVYSIEFD